MPFSPVCCSPLSSRWLKSVAPEVWFVWSSALRIRCCSAPASTTTSAFGTLQQLRRNKPLTVETRSCLGPFEQDKHFFEQKTSRQKGRAFVGTLSFCFCLGDLVVLYHVLLGLFLLVFRPTDTLVVFVLQVIIRYFFEHREKLFGHCLGILFTVLGAVVGILLKEKRGARLFFWRFSSIWLHFRQGRSPSSCALAVVQQR